MRIRAKKDFLHSVYGWMECGKEYDVSEKEGRSMIAFRKAEDVNAPVKEHRADPAFNVESEGGL